MIAVTETWLSDDDIDSFHMDDYDDIHTCRPNRGGGGVALYINRLLQSKPLPLLSKCILNCAEVICTEIIIPNGKNIVVASVNRAPNTDLPLLNDHIDYSFNTCKNKKVYLCGDFNVDLLKYSCHDTTSNFIDQLYSYGLHPLIIKPTRITKESATIINNIFTNELLRVTSSGLIINDLSDHLPIFQICDYTDGIHSCRNQYKTKETRLINDETLQHFSNALSSASWDDIVNDNDVNHSYRKFVNIFSETFNSSFPVRPGFPPKNRKHKPWMTKGLVNACKKKEFTI